MSIRDYNRRIILKNMYNGEVIQQIPYLDIEEDRELSYKINIAEYKIIKQMEEYIKKGIDLYITNGYKTTIE